VLPAKKNIYKNGTVIEPQEFKVKTDLESVDPNNVLAAATFVLVNGFDINQMKTKASHTKILSAFSSWSIYNI